MTGNRYLAALKENLNVLGLAGAVAASAALLTPVPLLVGLVAEALYLALVPDSNWYEARLSKRYDRQVAKRREEIKKRLLPQVRPPLQARYLRLEEMHRQATAAHGGDAQQVREVVRKLDFLLEKFIEFAHRESQYRLYLLQLDEQDGDLAAPLPQSIGSARPQRGKAPRVHPALLHTDSAQSDSWVNLTVEGVQRQYDQEIVRLQDRVAEEREETTKAVLLKRLDVLERRRVFVGKMGKILINLGQQLSLLEETFGLISDELRARPAEQVLADIEDVVTQTNAMNRLLEELNALDLGSPLPAGSTPAS